MEQPADRFGADRADGNEQQQCVYESGEDRRLLEAIGEPRRRAAPRQRATGPGDRQPQYVGEIVARVGQQRHRVGLEAKNDLDRDKAEVEGDSDGESLGEMSLPVPVPVIVIVIAV